MAVNLLVCPNCTMQLKRERLNAGPARCDLCGERLRIDLYPAAHIPTALVSAAPIAGEEEATCYLHADRRAEAVCDVCGRFLCRLCDLPHENRHFCATCLAAEQHSPGAVDEPNPFRTRYRRHDRIVLFLAIAPLLFVLPTIVTSPLALVLSVYYWKRSWTPLGRHRLGLLAAMVVSLVVTVYWLLELLRGGFTALPFGGA